MRELQLAALSEMAAAVNAGDAARYARVYADDAVIVIYGGARLQGRAAIEKYEIDLLSQFPGARLAFYCVWRRGSAAVVHYGVTGPGPGGRAMGHEGLLFYRFHPSGLIAEEHRYNDSLTPMAQLGLLAPGPVRAIPVLPSVLQTHSAGDTPREQANAEAARAMLAAADAGDASLFRARVAEAAMFDEMILPEPISATAWLGLWKAASRGLTTGITSLIAAGDFVLLEAVTAGTLDGAIGRIQARDKPFRIHRAFTLRLNDGRVDHAASFINGKELADAVGQSLMPPTSEP